MRRIHRSTLLSIALLLALTGACKGIAWSYTMNGYIYDQVTKDVLRNTAVMIGNEMITTDENGWYSISIHGVTCDRGGSRHPIERCNEEAFGQLVVRRLFAETSISIRTNWRDHACLDRVIFTPPCHLSRRDLFLP